MNGRPKLTTQVPTPKKEAGEPPEIEFFREISERFLYWNGREEGVCKNFAESYKRMMHELTSEVE